VLQLALQVVPPEILMNAYVPLSLFEKNRFGITSCAEKMEGVAGKEGQIPSEDFGGSLVRFWSHRALVARCVAACTAGGTARNTYVRGCPFVPVRKKSC
jgi:hypothetical protein